MDRIDYIIEFLKKIIIYRYIGKKRAVTSPIDTLIDQSLRPHCLQGIFSFQPPLGGNRHVSAYERSAAPL